MKRTALFLAALALAACDSEPQDPSEARLAELDAEDDLDELEAPEEGRHHKHGKRHGAHDGPSAEICEAIVCTDAQREQVQAIFARPERGDRGERPDLSAAHAALAKAFASTEFGDADIRAWSEQLPERPDHKSHRFDAMAELHAILSAEQRTALAEKVAAGEVFAGRGDGHRKHARSQGDKHEERRLAHFCESLDCSDAQQAQLAEIFAEKHASAPDPQVRRDAMAEAFKSDSFDEEALRESCVRDPEAQASTMLQVHAVLTPQQRTSLAERIAEHGPRALMGKGGRHGRHGKHRGRRGGRRGGRDGGREFG